MKKRMLWREHRRALAKTRGRFLSIMALLFLGSFALVGLKVSGPLLQENVDAYQRELQVMDLAVMSDHGLDEADKAELDRLTEEEEATVEYGYLTDTVVKDTGLAIRLFSEPETVSQYRVTDGRLPETDREIAVADFLRTRFSIGEELEVTEKDEDHRILAKHRFTVTGFVHSGELVSKDFLGSSSAGSGSLNGFAVVTAAAFDTEYAGIARLRFADLETASVFSDTYKEQVDEKRRELESILADNGSRRLKKLEEEAQAEIDRRFNEEKEKVLQQANAQGLASVEAVKPALPKLSKPTYTVYTRRSLPGGEGLVSVAVNTEGTTRVGDLFPVVLYLVAALVTMTTMTRFVNEERINAGVLAALGFSARDIIRKFTGYGLIAGLSGTILGILAGTFGLPLMIKETLLAGAALPTLRMHIFPQISIIALLCAWLCSVLPAWVIARRELHEVPAALLLPKPPARGSRILLERVGPIWRRLSFSAKVTARNLFRYKQRMLMTLFGVGGSVALLFAGLGIAASVESVSQGQFQEILHYDVLVQEKEATTETEEKKAQTKEELESLLRDSAITEELPLYTEQLSTSVSGLTDEQKISLMVAEGKTLEPMLSVFSTTGEESALPERGVVISEKLARLLAINEGDMLTVKRSDKTLWQVPVAAVARMYAGHYILMSGPAFEELFVQDWRANAHLLQLHDQDATAVCDLAARFMELRAVKAVVQNTNIQQQIATVSASLHRVMLILVAASILLAAVILYNLTAINVAERLRELSTVKVLGFYDREVTRYIFRETVYLSLIGIGLGWIGGYLLHRFLLRMVAPDHIMFPETLAVSTYVIPMVIISLIVAACGLLVHIRLKRVDMLEALKSVD
ncbi:MAG: ABC transporter permease [Eubacteriales bacterium]|nr:ABC transporter permease [Eubacteriales bacterium]